MKALLIALSAALLLGCGTGAVYQRSDSAPSFQIAEHEIFDAVPRREPIGTAGNKNPYTVNGVTYTLLPTVKGYRERGVASWYGTKFQGRPTANGEPYNLYAMTAAHKTLPIPCYVRVTNLDNGRSAIVRVNDRGPFHDGRIIDLSYAAAVKLGYAALGTARVEVQVIDLDETELTVLEGGETRYFLQPAAFQDADRAERLGAQLRERFSWPVAVMRDAQRGFYRVRIGPLSDLAAAEQLQQQLAAMGLPAAALHRE